jgi:hypothetical protein
LDRDSRGLPVVLTSINGGETMSRSRSSHIVTCDF